MALLEHTSQMTTERHRLSSQTTLPVQTTEDTVLHNLGNPVVLWGSYVHDPKELQGSTTRKSDFFDDISTQYDYSFGNICGHGSFQRMILAFCVLSLVVLQCHTLAFALIARDVEYWCKRPPEFDNMSDADWKKIGVPLESDGSYSRCKVYDRPGAPAAENRTTVFCDAWDFDTPSTTIISEWNLVCNREWLLSIARALYMVGGMVAVPAVGTVADHVGRRPVVCGAVIVLLFTGFSTCFAINFTLFVSVRCVVSACVSIIYVTAFILLFEVISVQHRTLFGTIAASLGFVMTNFMFAVLKRFDIEWRAVQLIFMVFTSMLISAFYILEESPRWLMATCDFKRAEQSILGAAKVNGERLEAVRKGYSKLAAEILKREGTLSPLRPTPLLLLKSPSLRLRGGMLYVCWFTVMLSFYGLSFVDVLLLEGWVQILDAIQLGPLAVIAYFAMNKWGRKFILILSLVLVAGFCVALAAAYSAGHFVLSSCFLVIAKAAAQIAVTDNYIYTAELFPTALRSVGVCVGYTFGRFGAAAASLLTSSGHIIGLNVSLIFIVCFVLCSVLAATKLPETLCVQLPNTVKEMEAESHHKPITNGRISPTRAKPPRASKDFSRTLSVLEAPVRK